MPDLIPDNAMALLTLVAIGLGILVIVDIFRKIRAALFPRDRTQDRTFEPWRIFGGASAPGDHKAGDSSQNERYGGSNYVGGYGGPDC